MRVPASLSWTAALLGWRSVTSSSSVLAFVPPAASRSHAAVSTLLETSSSNEMDRRTAFDEAATSASAILLAATFATVLPQQASAASNAKPAEFNEVGQQQSAPNGESPFVTLPNGVQIKDFKLGKDPAAASVAKVGSKVELTMKGRLLNLNGVIFYDTKSNDPDGFGEGSPLRFVVGDGTVLPGLEAGILGMARGGIRRVIVPPGLSYVGYPGLEPKPFTDVERRALDSVVKNPRRDATVLFDVKLDRVK